jgi:hypothetical protein
MAFNRPTKSRCHLYRDPSRRVSKSLLVLVLVFGGCLGPGTSVKKIDGLSPDERRAVLDLPLFDNIELKGKEHVVIKGVEGVSCQYRRKDPAATEADAMNDAKYWAKQQGAEGIKNLTCDPPRRRTFFHACWESITCTGQAIKLAK